MIVARNPPTPRHLSNTWVECWPRSSPSPWSGDLAVTSSRPPLKTTRRAIVRCKSASHLLVNALALSPERRKLIFLITTRPFEFGPRRYTSEFLIKFSRLGRDRRARKHEELDIASESSIKLYRQWYPDVPNDRRSCIGNGRSDMTERSVGKLRVLWIVNFKNWIFNSMTSSWKL